MFNNFNLSLFLLLLLNNNNNYSFICICQIVIDDEAPVNTGNSLITTTSTNINQEHNYQQNLTEAWVLKRLYKPYGSLVGDKALFASDSAWMNSLASWTLPKTLTDSLPLFFLTWYRNTLLGILIYLGTPLFLII